MFQLRAIRKEKRISQQKIAEYLKVSQQQVSKWEKNGNCDYVTVCKLCDILACSPNELYGWFSGFTTNSC